MRALTLHAAWAYAVRSLGKRIENRTWTPPAALIGERLPPPPLVPREGRAVLETWRPPGR
ncbi:MAG: hypothetical protein H6722_27065 [Sandaracinus sp.]|nr:hypothetical protein [Sandaracinus sp.]MCB9616114.1 hypothetical protein [Sandaracinus sp.]MCB9620454.1 hypothetical protein [Sandaracinus sp.]MCB9624690.1 hypothetical protein [Sandaracinus sp.]